MAVKASRRGKRYSEAQKQQILSAARKEGLTGAQVKKRFGVSTLTFYRWRGSVRARRGRPVSAGRASAPKTDGIRDQVRETVRAMLPQVIRSEVAAYLNELLGRRGPGRPRKGA